MLRNIAASGNRNTRRGLYSFLDRRRPRRPRKWVENPHGLATVSGERRFTSTGPSCWPGTVTGRDSLGRREATCRSASQETCHGGVLVPGATDAERSTRVRVPHPPAGGGLPHRRVFFSSTPLHHRPDRCRIMTQAKPRAAVSWSGGK